MNVAVFNHWGEIFIHFAGAMLWQSSLLVAVIFALDLLLAKKLRASVRYALWLVVLLKLVLPPSLAWPTSPAWWIHQTPAVVVKPQMAHYTIAYDSQPLPENSLPVVVSPKPVLAAKGRLLLSAVAISAALLVWLLIRWLQVLRHIWKADASEHLTGLVVGLKCWPGMKFLPDPVVKKTSNVMSPAVCGLFRPAILIPQSLADNFSDEQLRAVLLHELIHLRRGDIWMNCAQALLQIVYWWHPLLWLANARIRRLREEAVDDAVMLALEGNSEVYAPTLLEVAKFAFRRPLASLGLVGILESRSALRQRIERLINFSAPRKAGLTAVSVIGIFVFSAIALPMGQAPVSTAKGLPADDVVSAEKSFTVKVDPDIFTNNILALAAHESFGSTNDYTAVLLDLLRAEDVDSSPPHGIVFNRKTGEVTMQNTPEQLELFRQVIEQLNRADGKPELPLRNNFRRKSVLIEARLYPVSASRFEGLVSGLQYYRGKSDDDWWSVSPENFKQFITDLESSDLKLVQHPRIQTGSGMEADFYSGRPNDSVEFDCKPFANDGSIDLAVRSTVINGEPPNVFTNQFGVQASAQTGGGIVIGVKNFEGNSNSNLMVVINMQIVTNAPHFHERLQTIIRRSGSGTNVFQRDLESEKLAQDGKVLYEMGKLDEAEIRLKAAIAANPENQTAQYYLRLIHPAPGLPKTVYFAAVGRRRIVEQLDQIRLNHFGPFVGTSLSEVIRQLNDSAKSSGAEFSILVSPTAYGDSVAIKMPVALTNPTLGNVIDAILLDAAPKGVNKPLQYSVQDDAIVFSIHTNVLYSRHYKLNTNAVVANLRMKTGVNFVSDELWQNLYRYFTNADINFSPPKSIFYNDRLGELFVRGTERDLDQVEQMLSELDNQLPQIHIKARFIEVPKGTMTGLGNMIGSPGQLTGILTGPNAKTALKALEGRTGYETLAVPEVVTIGGRQTQMRATTVQTIITNMTFRENWTNEDGMISTNAVFPETTRIETGPVLDVVPKLLPDGHTIDLRATAWETRFFGYAEVPKDSKVHWVTNSAGEPIGLPNIWPAIEVDRNSAHADLYDGQTLVLLLNNQPEQVQLDASDKARQNVVAKHIQNAKSKTGEKEVVVFISMALLDSAGNRMYPENESLMTPAGIPAQPAQ
ncbi:MAG TPA: M56 family metallopeptidase [Verrucomicrobiae bacterium]|nr:M56 family metallopeptidase [Verrucomicrobiae bacterium]